MKKLAKTRRVLLHLADKIADSVEVLTSRSLFNEFIGGGLTAARGIARRRELYEINQALADLKRRKFISAKKMGDRLVVTLTDKGWIAGIRDRVRLAEQYPDKRVCIVSFDIPEQERGARLQLRRFLKDCGFTMHHHSLWVSDQNVENQLVEFVNELGIARWVHVYSGKAKVLDIRPDRQERKRRIIIDRKNELDPGIMGKKKHR